MKNSSLKINSAKEQSSMNTLTRYHCWVCPIQFFFNLTVWNMPLFSTRNFSKLRDIKALQSLAIEKFISMNWISYAISSTCAQTCCSVANPKNEPPFLSRRNFIIWNIKWELLTFWKQIVARHKLISPSPILSYEWWSTRSRSKIWGKVAPGLARVKSPRQC